MTIDIIGQIIIYKHLDCARRFLDGCQKITIALLQDTDIFNLTSGADTRGRDSNAPLNLKKKKEKLGKNNISTHYSILII